MDSADRASRVTQEAMRRAERDCRESLRVRELAATGSCHYCGGRTWQDGQLFCDSSCAEDHERSKSNAARY